MIKNIFFGVLLFTFFSCENHRFDRDKRQIIAKNEISTKLRKTRSFDIISFKEDTLSWPDSAFKRPIRYTLDIVYNDSASVLQKKKGIVIFTPDGNSIINSQITDSIP